MHQRSPSIFPTSFIKNNFTNFTSQKFSGKNNNGISPSRLHHHTRHKISKYPDGAFHQFDFPEIFWQKQKQTNNLTLITGPKNNHVKQVLGSFLTPT